MLTRKKITFSTITYESNYDSDLLRGQDDPKTPRPWNLPEEIISHSEKNQTLLDIGCGTSFKLVALSPHFKQIMALDPSESMLCASQETIRKNNLHNLQLIQGKGEKLPFHDESFDLVTCMISRWHVPEIHRVLKSNGKVIVEHFGNEDKKAFKQLFGKDSEGWRGHHLNYKKHELLEIYNEIFQQYFRTVIVREGYWNTFYTPEGILELLKYTPTIRNFDETKDARSVQQAIKKFNTPHGIKLCQHRIFIYATNN